MTLALDLAIAGLMVGVAWRLLSTRDAFEAVVLYIALGLVLALAWVRLGATDVALAEAALGAGVTGALLLNALRRLARPSPDEAVRSEPAGAVGRDTAIRSEPADPGTERP